MNKQILLLASCFVYFAISIHAQRVMNNSKSTNPIQQKKTQSDVVLKDQNERKLNVGLRTWIIITSMGNFYFEG